MKKILMITSEAAPFAKTGGLGDVIGSLPQALADQGCELGVILPKYGGISEEFTKDFEFITKFDVKMGWRSQYCGLFRYKYGDVTFYFIDNEYYFGDDILYHYYDRDIERFSFFDRAVLEAIPHLDVVPEVLHCHDWQTGMIPLLLEAQYQDREPYQQLKTMFTIHNLQYQGIYNKEVVADLLNLSHTYFTQDKAGFFDQANYLKAGIVFAGTVTTVSESYAEEIKYPFFGENLDELIRQKSYKLYGILNGIDYRVFNPLTDPEIEANYDMDTVEMGKAKNKAALQKELGIEVNPDLPILSIVSRLTNQKGLDLINGVMDEIMAEGVQLVVLGTGDDQYQDMFLHYEDQNPTRVSANIRFDAKLAQRIYASSDLFLMPSLFEPCGIGQMIAARYGTIPLVREVGGLKDTVSSYNTETQIGNGFSFTNYNAHDMLYTIRRGVKFYHDKKTWNKIIQNAMTTDFSWKKSAKAYIELYDQLFE